MKKKIVIAGGTGLIGSRFIEIADKSKYELYVLTRDDNIKNPRVNFIKWNPGSGTLDLSRLEPIHAVINLAGAGIADKRWSNSRKKLILKSRLDSTFEIKHALENLKSKPEIYVGASAVGYYGDRGDVKLSESASSGADYLAEVCRKWESAHLNLSEKVNRMAILRIGIVLSSRGGALAEIIKKSILGIYSFFGNGKDFYSWIHIDDLCRIILYMVTDFRSEGIYNVCAENPVTNKRLVNAIAKTSSAFGCSLAVPKFILRVVLGELSKSLLVSIRANPKRLLEQNFEFEYKKIETAIKDIINRKI